MLSFLPQCIWTAFSLSYYSGILVLEISGGIDNTYGDTINADLKNEYAMLCMVALGVGEMLGG